MQTQITLQSNRKQCRPRSHCSPVVYTTCHSVYICLIDSSMVKQHCSNFVTFYSNCFWCLNFFPIFTVFKYEPPHDKTNKLTHAPREDSDAQSDQSLLGAQAILLVLSCCCSITNIQLTVSAFLWNITDIDKTVLRSSRAAARLFHSRSSLAAWIRMVFCA